MIDLLGKIFVTEVIVTGVFAYLSFATDDWRKERIRKLKLAENISLSILVITFLIKIWSM
jgi:hypothetical protein